MGKQRCSDLPCKMLASDDCVVSEIAPSERLQVLLGRMFAESSKKYCKKGMDMGSVNRKIHTQTHPAAAIGCRPTRSHTGCAFASKVYLIVLSIAAIATGESTVSF